MPATRKAFMLALCLVCGCDSSEPGPAGNAHLIVGSWHVVSEAHRSLVTSSVAQDHIDFGREAAGAITVSGAASHTLRWGSYYQTPFSPSVNIEMRNYDHCPPGSGRAEMMSSSFPGRASLFTALRQYESAGPVSATVSGPVIRIARSQFVSRGDEVFVEGEVTFPTVALRPGVEAALSDRNPVCYGYPRTGFDMRADGSFTRTTRASHEMPVRTTAGRWSLEGDQLRLRFLGADDAPLTFSFNPATLVWSGGSSRDVCADADQATCLRLEAERRMLRPGSLTSAREETVLRVMRGSIML